MEEWPVSIVVRINPASYELEVLLERNLDSKCGWTFPFGKADQMGDSHMNFLGGAIRLLKERFGTGPDGIELDHQRDGLWPIKQDQLKSKECDRDFQTTDGGRPRQFHFRHFMCPAWSHPGWRAWTPELTPLRLAEIAGVAAGPASGPALMLNKKQIAPPDTMVCWTPVGDLKIGYRSDDFNDDIIRMWYEKTGYVADLVERTALYEYHEHLPLEPCRVTAVFGYNLEAADDPDIADWMASSVDGQKMWENWREMFSFLFSEDTDTAAQAVQYIFKSSTLVEAFKRWEDAGLLALSYPPAHIRGVPQGENWSDTEGGQQIIENFFEFMATYATYDEETQIQIASHCFEKFSLLETCKLYVKHQDLPHDPTKIHL